MMVPNTPTHQWVNVFPVIGSQLTVQSQIASPSLEYWLVDMTRGFPIYFRMQVVTSYIDVANVRRWAQSSLVQPPGAPENDGTRDR
jgi:hypothetical protein